MPPSSKYLKPGQQGRIHVSSTKKATPKHISKLVLSFKYLDKVINNQLISLSTVHKEFMTNGFSHPICSCTMVKQP